MKKLHIYPTSRALRMVSALHREQEGFTPALMRMDEFEQRAILIEGKMKIDPLERVLLLRESAKIQAFDKIKLNLDLVRFFTRSEALFKFFEELSQEEVSFETLAEADAYVEFETHLNILEQILGNYKKLLDKRNLTDKAFIPNEYVLNEGFISSYESIEVHLEGYLSHFELTLLDKIAQITPLNIHYHTSKFNAKMQERFGDLGMELPNNHHIHFSLSDKKLISKQPNKTKVTAKILSVEERQEQIAVAFVQIDEMINAGMKPENIVLVLPDESFKEQFTLFDTHHNLNFAMGYDYSNGRIYKSLEALYLWWQKGDKEALALCERYGFSQEKISHIIVGKKIGIEPFFEAIDSLELLDCPLVYGDEKESYSERVYEKYRHFKTIFEDKEMRHKEWLFLWLKTLSDVTIDDVRGGLITVMGVLETRGVSFEGVVIVDFNEGVVPASSSKDQFLNSAVRAFASLPTKHDREALQKQYYKRLLEEAKTAVILYSSSDNKLPSKFLYELGLGSATPTQAQGDLLYSQASKLIIEKDPIVEKFVAQDIVWSASRLKTYLECKRKYYYRYEQKISAKKDDEPNEGAFLHTLLDHLHREENHYANEADLTLAIHKLLDKLLPFDSSKVAYQKLLWKEKLKGYINEQVSHFEQEWRVTERETEFQGTIGGLKFKGRIDRIDQTSTHTLVLDYKSGKTTEAQKTKNLETLTDLQMSIYHQMLKDKYPNITLAFVKILDGGALEEIKALEEKNTLLFEKIVELKQCNSFLAKKCEELAKCKYCEFVLMCERGEYV